MHKSPDLGERFQLRCNNMFNTFLGTSSCQSVNAAIVSLAEIKYQAYQEVSLLLQFWNYEV